MKQFSKYIVTGILGIFIGLMLFKAFDCSDQPASVIKRDIEELNRQQAAIQKQIKESEARAQLFRDSMLYYAKQKPIIREYYNYVYNQVDSIVDRDSNDVYRLIRAYADSIRTAEQVQ